MEPTDVPLPVKPSGMSLRPGLRMGAAYMLYTKSTVRVSSWNQKNGLRVFHAIVFTRQVCENDDGKFVINVVLETVQGRVAVVPLLSELLKRTFDVRIRLVI